MATDRTDPDDFVSSNVLGAAELNQLPRGRIGRDTLTSNSSGTTTTENTLQVTVTIPADRTLHIHGQVTVRSNIAGGVQIAILEDATQINRKNYDALAPGRDLPLSIEVETHPTGPGSITYTLVTGVAGVAGNTVTAVANGSTGTSGIGVLYVDDVGPDY